MDLNIELLPWQQEVWADDTRFKIVAAGRRTGKSRLAAWMLIVNALQAERGHVFYVAPTQGQARDIMWSTLLDLGHEVIRLSVVVMLIIFKLSLLMEPLSVSREPIDQKPCEVSASSS
jgi:hypothetical protein